MSIRSNSYHSPKAFTLFLALFISLCAFSAFAVNQKNYGLNIKSHLFPPAERTLLTISPDKPIPLDRKLTVNFDMTVRDEPQFGRIAIFIADNGTQIDFITSSGNSEFAFYPALRIADNLYTIPTQIITNVNKNVTIDFDKLNSQIIFKVADDSIEIPADLSQINNFEIMFGHFREMEAAPVNISDIRVDINDQPKMHWEMRLHNETIVYDTISSVPATVKNPHWIINDHTDMRQIFSYTSTENIQTTYNPIDNVFYLVTDSKITVYNPSTRETSEIPVAGGYRAMIYSNHLAYVPADNSLVSYNLKRRIFSKFNFNTRRWSQPLPIEDEATFADHAWVMTDSIGYAFAGYGFYHYSNNFYTVDLRNGHIEEHTPDPAPNPRNSAAAGFANGKLYIFGGRGNESGRQEMSSRHFYDLYEFDPSTFKGQLLWEVEETQPTDFILASTMYYNPADSCFYAGTTAYNGSIYKISVNRPEFYPVSSGTPLQMNYREFVFDLYHNQDNTIYYLLVDKRMQDNSHDISIFSILPPFNETPSTIQPTPEPDKKTGSLWIIITCIIIALLIPTIIHFRHSNKTTPEKQTNPTTPKPEAPAPDTEKTDTSEEEGEEQRLLNSINVPTYYDRSHSAISLLGTLNIRDKEGNNITSLFTSRLKNLLIMVLLYRHKHKNGIPVSEIDEIIWGDKDERAARNNRNVYIHKLRGLFEKIGNISLSVDSGYLHIDLGNVFLDYDEALRLMQDPEVTNLTDTEKLNRTIELLFFGPLLQGIYFDWVNQFKDEYSRMSITLLDNLLPKELHEGNDAKALKIAETILLHDPMSEEALHGKCTILCRHKMVGLARNAYETFAKEYRKSMGEPFPTPFSDFCK